VKDAVSGYQGFIRASGADSGTEGDFHVFRL
jgi:hypothetical protein